MSEHEMNNQKEIRVGDILSPRKKNITCSQNVIPVIPMHISKPCKCLSLLGTSFSDTSSVVYAALHTEAGFCYGLIVT